jgi:hypothetical protein
VLKNRIELLREFESIFKTALAHESGDPGVPFNEKKTEGRKSRETVPSIPVNFKYILSFILLAAGAVAGGLAKTVIAPLDRYKKVKQIFKSYTQ